uniref:Uncharacterized protein n=2 Tax=Picea TaxID=3328 RepID=A0A117NJA0_PICGL|nr:hypothetical protein ABT39_MTgene1034 [Picea glauca]QHR90044.1 hypothetical protein Q903MT_gene4067 [Picea sitchensis]
MEEFPRPSKQGGTSLNSIAPSWRQRLKWNALFVKAARLGGGRIACLPGRVRFTDSDA